jgi:hypothetical protein
LLILLPCLALCEEWPAVSSVVDCSTLAWILVGLLRVLLLLVGRCISSSVLDPKIEVAFLPCLLEVSGNLPFFLPRG